MKNEGSVQFKLGKIVTDKFSTYQVDLDAKNQYAIDYGIDFGVDSSNNSIVCFLNIRLRAQENPFIELNMRMEFILKQDSWLEFTDSESITIPAGLAKHFAMITVGTSRGIIHAKTEGSNYNNHILPAINVENLINEDLILDLKES